jgi:hypothetical protein
MCVLTRMNEGMKKFKNHQHSFKSGLADNKFSKLRLMKEKKLSKNKNLKENVPE